MTDVLDGEVLSDTTDFTPSLPTRLLGWCNDALDLPMSGPEKRSLHSACPAIISPQVYNDPARKGSTFSSPGCRCACVCHSRPVL